MTPDVHAEPDEAPILYSVSRKRMASPSMYSKLMFVVFGSLLTVSPFTHTGTAFHQFKFELVAKPRRGGCLRVQVGRRQFSGLPEGRRLPSGRS